MRRFYFILGTLILTMLVRTAGAETFKLNSGETVAGELLSGTANDTGVQIKVGEDKYERFPWGGFSQEEIQKFARNPKFLPFVEPFIEVSADARHQRTEITLKPVEKLQRPAPQSLFGAMFGSGLGVLILLLIYAANIFAGYEVALFRAQPPALVAGLAAIPILGFLSPIIFVCLPTRLKSSEEAPLPAEAAAPAYAADGTDMVNPMQAEGAEHPSALHITGGPAEAAKSELPAPVIYQRGQFTFNRRFFETKFPGFFGVVRRDADRDMVLVIKSARGQYIGQRISRIAANDLHLQIQKGAATEEVQIPFMEVQEIRHQHRNLPL